VRFINRINCPAQSPLRSVERPDAGMYLLVMLNLSKCGPQYLYLCENAIFGGGQSGKAYGESLAADVAVKGVVHGVILKDGGFQVVVFTPLYMRGERPAK